MQRRARSSGITKKQIALLHVAKRDLGLTDDDYRAILARYGNCESASDLDAFGFEHVMRYFTALGFRSTWTKRTYGNRPDMASPAQIDLMRSLWKQFSGQDDTQDAELNRWLARFHHVSALRFVNAEKAGKVIPALRAMASRKQKHF